MSNSNTETNHKWFWLIVVPILVIVIGGVITESLIGDVATEEPPPIATSTPTTAPPAIAPPTTEPPTTEPPTTEPPTTEPPTTEPPTTVSPTAVPPTTAQPQAVIDLGLWEYNGNRPPLPAPAQEGEIIFAHGDITNTGPCNVRTFAPDERIDGLGQGTFRLLRIIGPPEYIQQRKAEAHQQAANGIESNTGRTAEEICPTYRI